MKYILLFLILFTLSTHWHHKEQTRVREYVYLRADRSDAVAQASEHFNLSVEEVEEILGNSAYR
jgi:hypothetical protein